MNSEYIETFSRNYGFISEAEQKVLRYSTVGIAGMGGVGGLLAERLIRAGIGHLRVTDSGTFEKSNLNRQFGSSNHTLGQNKASVIFHLIKDINPEAKIEYYEDGLKNESDVDTFVDGCDVIIDEMDTTAFKQSILLQRASRKLGLYYLFSGAVGFGGIVVVFDPEGQNIEDYNGMASGVNLEHFEQTTLPFEKAVPLIPSYANTISPTLIGSIMKGEAPIPTNSIGVGLASIIGANEAVNILTKKREIISAPRYIYIDLIDLKFIIGKMP